jgi:hypothetical protein
VIQAAVQTDKGPIGIIGINHENWRRMRAGMPLHINIQQITPPGTRIDQLIVHYAETYEQVVDDLALGGIVVPEALRQEAKAMDIKLKRNRRRG